MADVAAAPRLKFLDTTLYALVAAVGIRWIAVAAALGPSSLPMWLLAFFTFYVPLSVAVVELTSRFPGAGSLYGWARGTFGPLAGFLCGWFYWVSLLPYFASIIYGLSGVILSIFGMDAHNTTAFLGVSVAITVFTTGLQLLGLRLGKWSTNLGGIGTWFVFALFLVAALVLALRGQSATHFLSASYMPPARFDTAILWGTIVFGLCGSETLAFLRNDIEGGLRTIIRVLIVLGVAMILLYMAGTAAMLTILPEAALTRLMGLPDAMHAAFARMGAPSLSLVAIGFYAISSLGGLMAWFGIATRLPVEAGVDSFLPASFARQNPKTGVAAVSVLFQGAMTLLIVLMSQAGEGAAAAYDFLVSMAVLVTTIPYVFVFAAYLCRARWPLSVEAWLPPGGATMGRLLGVVGMIATLTAIVCTMIPNDGDPHPAMTFGKIAGSSVAIMIVGLALYAAGTRRRAAALALEVENV